MNTLIVTGALGQLGKTVTERLRNYNYKVYAYDKLSYTSLNYPVRTIDPANLEDGFYWPFEAETIIHSAGRWKGLGHSLSDLQSLLESNFHSLIGSLAACGEGIKHFVYVSSMSVYSGKAHVPSAETDLVEPTSFYGFTKWLGEQACRIFQEFRHDINFTIVRLSQVYGPGTPDNLAIYRFIDQAMNYRQIKMTCVPDLIRDHIYIDDATEALAQVVKYKPKGVFNIGGCVHIMGELASTIADIIGEYVEIIYVTDKGEDRALSSKAFEKATGFQINISLQEGIEREITRLRHLRQIKAN